jgi:hypothetical protein
VHPTCKRLDELRRVELRRVELRRVELRHDELRRDELRPMQNSILRRTSVTDL